MGGGSEGAELGVGQEGWAERAGGPRAGTHVAGADKWDKRRPWPSGQGRRDGVTGEPGGGVPVSRALGWGPCDWLDPPHTKWEKQ